MKAIKLFTVIFAILSIVFLASFEKTNDLNTCDAIISKSEIVKSSVVNSDRISRLDDIPNITTIPPEQNDGQNQISQIGKVIYIPFFYIDELISILEEIAVNQKDLELWLYDAVVFEYDSEDYETVHWLIGCMTKEYFNSGRYKEEHFTKYDFSSVEVFSEVYYRDTYGQFNVPSRGDKYDNMSTVNISSVYTFPMRLKHRRPCCDTHIPQNFDRSKMVVVEDPPGYMPASETMHWIAYEDIALVLFDKFYDDVNDERYQKLLDSLIFIDTDGRVIMPDGTVRILGAKTN